MSREDPKYLRRLERLLETSRLLNSTLELTELTEIVLRIVKDEVPVERCTLFVVDHRQQLLRSFIAQGIETFEITLPFGHGLAGSVAATGKVIDIDDDYRDQRFDPAFDDRSAFRTKDVFGLPIFNREGTIIGVLQLLNRHRRLDVEDRDFLSSMCTYIGIALQNAWAHHELIESRKLEQELTIVRDRLAEAERR